MSLSQRGKCRARHDALQCFVSPMPPVKNQKSMDAGPGDDQVAHESFTNVRFTELAGQRYTTANHHPRTNTQIFHCCVMDGTSRVVEEDVDALGGGFLHSSSKIGSFFIIDCRIEADLATPLKFLVVSGDGDRTTSGQFGDLADKLAYRS